MVEGFRSSKYHACMSHPAEITDMNDRNDPMELHGRMSEPKGRKSREKSVARMVKLPVGLLVLMALVEGPAHSEKLTRRIIGDTMGRFVEPSTLHDELVRLELRGLVVR